MSTPSTPTSTSENDISKSEILENLALGSGLAVSGNCLISASLNLQKYVHLQNAKADFQRHYTKDYRWWIGIILMGIGELFNFTAYGFAPASVVAPLGSTTVIANLFLAAIFLKEKIRAENLFGCALAIVGAFLLVTFSKQTEAVLNGDEIVDSLAQPIFIAYVCIEVVILAILLCMLYHKKMKHVLIYLLISSITASFTVISAKAVSGMVQLSFAGRIQWDEPVLYIMLVVLFVTALIQIKYVNMAMKDYDATVVVPVNFVIFTLSAILAGIVFYKEFYGLTGIQITMFLFGCMLSFIAVYFIAVGKLSTPTGTISDIAPQHVTSDLIPSWMTADVNVGHVQPSGGVEHLKDVDSDRMPILHCEGGLPTIRETEGPDSPGDGISVTSMDMLIDREKMGAEKYNYGATSPKH